MALEIREPLLFTPVIQDKLWGGDGLWRKLGKGSAASLRAGESWELSDRPEAPTAIASGRFTGKSLRDLWPLAGPALMGKAWRSDLATFPLLYKFISAREALSVQVHPGENSPLGEAKTECWYVLDAPTGAELIVGLSQALPRSEMVSLLSSSASQTVLRREPVQRGDLLYIPAGTVHAITAGLLLYEMQQNSDTTFRLYDWDRRDDHGQPRALHVTQAAEVMDLRVHDHHKITALDLPREGCSEQVLVACPYFAMSRWHGFTKPTVLRMKNQFKVVTVIGGKLLVEWPGGSLEAGLGATVLFPADLNEALLSAGSSETEILVSAIPDLLEDVVMPLRKAGHTDAAISALSGIDGLSVD
jgi:mannose-6-phosphate isomerase